MSDHDIIKCCTSLNPKDDYLIVNQISSELELSHYEKILYYDITLLSLSNLSESRLYKDTSSSGRSDRTTDLHLLGSINGLVCLFSENLDQFVVFNPAIRQAKYIDPPFRPCKLDEKLDYFYGFCWDAVKNDFKVVVTYDYYNRITSDEGPLYSSYVYSCKCDSWSIMLPHFPFNCGSVDRSMPSAIINGMPYWTGSRLESKNLFSVLKFEVGRNEFRMLPKFECSAASRLKFLIVDIKEYIYALVYEERPFFRFVDVRCFDERYGVWIKMYNVGPITCHKYQISPFLKFDDDIVFRASGKLMCHDRKTNKNKDLGIIGGYLRSCFSYKPSLVFLKGMKPTTSSRGFSGSNEGNKP